MKHFVFAGVAASALLAGCAGPMGPPLGLGPEGDSIATILMFALVVAIAYRPIRSGLIHRLRQSQGGSAQRIAKERYARGDITEDEYQRIMRQLSSP